MQDDGASEISTNQSVITSISWEASEYLHHEKDYLWAGGLSAIIVGLAILVYLLLKDIWSVVVVTILGSSVGILAFRKPRTLNYRIDASGIQVGSKPFSYEQFRSFSIIDEGPVKSIYLESTQRYIPALSIYFSPEDEKKITQALSTYLPYRQRDLEFTDIIFRKLRF